MMQRFDTRAAKAAKGLGHFRQDESGGMIIFALFMLVLMLMVGGMAVDLMRLETTRTKLQGTLDRAVLAAADLDQTRPPLAVVQDYMNKAGMASNLVGVPVVTQGLNYRIVTANAQARVPMLFSNLDKVFGPAENLGTLESMTIPTASRATELVAKVEISLVLDISGSMANDSKIENLRTAADEFLTSVLKPANANRISVSLIPYSEHVNVGPTLYNQLLTTTRHNYSHCLEVPDNQFNTAALNLSYRFLQMQHFQWNYDGSHNYRDDTVCPRYSYERIKPWSQSLSQLKTQVSQLQPRAGTSIFLGMKWGAALLDPSTRPVLTNLISNGSVDSVFAGRPVNYNDPETLKTIILMTDGQNDNSYRIQDWAYDSASEYANWEDYNLWYYLYRYVSRNRGSYYQQRYNANIGDNLLDQICTAAKAQGIVVWTIAFEAPAHGQDVMQECASSPSHYFDVDGVEISDAFSAIARQINNLKLTN